MVNAQVRAMIVGKRKKLIETVCMGKLFSDLGLGPKEITDFCLHWKSETGNCKQN